MKSVLAVKSWGTRPDVSSWEMSMAHVSLLVKKGATMCVAVFVQVYVHRKTREQTYVIPQVPLIMLFEIGSLTALKLTR